MPADPVVSPADTPATHDVRLRVERKYEEEVAQQKNSGHAGSVIGWLARVSYKEWFALADERAALLAVGERDRRQIARLTKALLHVGDGELTNLCWCGDEWIVFQDGEPFDDDFKHSEWCLLARAAVLADEEDADNG